MLNAQVDWERLNIASLKNNALVKAFADENATGAYGADKAVDGIYSTRWGAGNNTGACSWWIDLGKTYAVSMICPLWENYARQYEVYMATEKGADGIPLWGTIPAVSQDKRLGEYIRTYISDGVTAGNYISDPHVFDSPVKARYIKIKQLRSASASWGSSLWEMQVLGTPENAGTSIGKTTASHAENPAHACPGIYTLSGVKVHQKPARGDIYLQGGRKYVMR